MYKWKPSRAAAREYAEKMQEITDFCEKNKISHSNSYDSYYFEVAGQKYRVSNHTIEASNAAAEAFDPVKGFYQSRDLYHPAGRESDTVYIHAGKTRIIEIYTALKEGKSLDGRGNVKQ